MAKFIVDLWMDGYEDNAEMEKACEDFIYDQLNMSSTSVKVFKHLPQCKCNQYPCVHTIIPEIFEKEKKIP